MLSARHHIDQLIEERAPWLMKNNIFSMICRGIIFKLLNYNHTVTIAEHLNHYDGRQIFDVMGRYLARHVRVDGLHHIPKDGAALIVCNHPTGIADGLILHHILQTRRKDAYFLANRDVLRLYPQLKPMIAPVEWRQEKRSYETMRQTLSYIKEATHQGRLAVIFPSGRLAERRWLKLYERPWMHSAAMLAQRYQLPVIPIHISARNSVLFYILDLIHPSLRDITLFHETLNKRSMRFSIQIGDIIPPEQLELCADIATQTLKSQVEALASGKKSSPGWLMHKIRALKLSRSGADA